METKGAIGHTLLHDVLHRFGKGHHRALDKGVGGLSAGRALSRKPAGKGGISFKLLGRFVFKFPEVAFAKLGNGGYLLVRIDDFKSFYAAFKRA